MLKKSHLIKLLKFSLALAIIGYLVWDATRHESFQTLIQQPKHWGLLALATAACLVGLLFSFVRWYMLVRALQIPFTLRDALRLGFLGYMFNFVAPGNVGGDLFKAVFLAKERPGSRAETVASVIIDRIIGLYALFVIASVAIIAFGQLHSENSKIQLIAKVAVIMTAIGTVGMVVLMLPSMSGGAVTRSLGNIPRVGPTFRRLFEAINIYRTRPRVLVIATVMSFGVHASMIASVYLIACGLPGKAPSLADHTFIVPVAMLAGAMPITPNGLGTFELVMNYLYQHMPSSIDVGEGEGTMVALGYRLITILIALIGVGFYLGHRREMDEVLHEVEEEEEVEAKA